jgi:hypothetical protein
MFGYVRLMREKYMSEGARVEKDEGDEGDKDTETSFSCAFICVHQRLEMPR